MNQRQLIVTLKPHARSHYSVLEKILHRTNRSRYKNGMNRWPAILMAVCLYGLTSAYTYAGDIDVFQNRPFQATETGVGEFVLSTVDDASGASSNTIKSLPFETKVDIDVSGMIARVSVTQAFENKSDEWVNGVYTFPLPEKSAVNRMRMTIGERIIEGEIKEKNIAKKIFNDAKAAGRKASLVEQQRPNMFTTQVANIAPHETIVINLEYIETIQYHQGEFSLRFPMPITPRYMPGTPIPSQTVTGIEQLEEQTSTIIEGSHGWATNTNIVPDAEKISPFLNPRTNTASNPINPVSIHATLDMGMPLTTLESLHHEISWSNTDNRYSLDLVSKKKPYLNSEEIEQRGIGKTLMNQDFVLRWAPSASHEPKAAVFSENIEGSDYGLVMVVPPTLKPKNQLKEVIYVIDTSGSMGGSPIQQAQSSLLYALKHLSPKDRFNIIAFNSNSQRLFQSAVPASPKNIHYAELYVKGLRAQGGTEMLSAMNMALASGAPEGFVRQVLFITDGAIGNEQQLFAAIHNDLNDSRLFTVGIGAAPNSFFMRKAAQFGRGNFTYIGDVNDVSRHMTKLLDSISRPAMTNITVQWPSASEPYPERIPDLYSGSPLLISSKLPNLKGDIVVSGSLAGERWQHTIHNTGNTKHQGIASLWARQKIESLLDRKYIGGDAAEIRDQVLSVALTHQMMSPYTSFVAVEKAISRPKNLISKDKNVLNAPPKGQSPQPYAYPKTATRALESFYIGLCLMILTFLLWICNRRKNPSYHTLDYV